MSNVKNAETLELESLAAGVPGQGSALVARDLSLVAHVDVEVSVLVGHASVPLQKLFSMKAGETLALNETVTTPVTVLVNSRPVARGELVAVGDYFGVRISEIS